MQSPTLLTKSERRSYSLTRGLLNANIRSPNNGTSLEAALSRAAQSLYSDIPGFRTDGLHVPGEVLLGDRGLSATTYTAGEALVGEDHDSIFSKYLFPQSVVMGLGANFLGGLNNKFLGATGNFGIPAISGASEGQWLSEGEAATDQTASLTAALRQATPKRVTATIVVGNQLLAQTGPDGEAALWRILMAGVAAAIDRATLAGSGGVQPLGLLKNPDITAISLGTNGGALTLAKLNDIENAPVVANVPLMGGGYALSPATRKKGKAIQTATGTSTFLVSTTEGRDQCNGYRSFATPFLPDDLGFGSGTALGSLVFGADWRMCHVCQWGGLSIVANPYTQATNNRTILTVTAMLDVVSPYLGAFAVCRNILNT